jgi:hypothetical protein
MKVLVCGPRVWLDQKPIDEVLRQFPPGTIIVHGAARGADAIAGFVGELLGFEVREYPVDHALDGPWPAAGVRRNLRMLKSEHPSKDGTYVDVGVAFKLTEELSVGTGRMVEFMREAQPLIDVREILHPKARRLRANG